MPHTESSIVIVGGGFAGTTLARALDARRLHGLQITLISDESYTTFHPMLPEAVGASVFPEQVVAPVREMLDLKRGDRFIMGRVVAVDTSAHTLRCDTLAGERELRYDHLVLAFGNRARLDLLPGMALHALPLKTVGDALHIRNVVLRRLARIELEDDAALRREMGHFVIIGGGFSGVEVAGELVDCLAGIRRFYPRVAHGELQVTLLHEQDRLLPEMSPALADAALRSLRRRGVDVQLGRISFPAGEEPIGAVVVSCDYGFSANLGGGTYDRLAPTRPGETVDTKAAKALRDPKTFDNLATLTFRPLAKAMLSPMSFDRL